MKKIIGIVLAAVIAVAVSAVFAGGDGCCAAKAGAKANGACSDMFSKLNLTPEQHTKVLSLQEEAKRAPSTSESHAIMSAGLEKILTPEQLTQLKAECGKAKSSGCPFKKSDKKS